MAIDELSIYPASKSVTMQQNAWGEHSVVNYVSWVATHIHCVFTHQCITEVRTPNTYTQIGDSLAVTAIGS